MSAPAPKVERGRLVRWDAARGFGFVAPDGGGRELFLHVRDLPRGARPRVGARVRYRRSADDARRPRAVAARIGGTPGPAVAATGRGLLGLAPAGVPLAVLAASAAGGRIPWGVPGLVAAASLVAAALFAVDKAAARAGRRRVPETTLHLWCLVGGWPGAWSAARLLPHKTRKTAFRTVFAVTVVANLAVLGWLHTPQGAAAAFRMETRLTPLTAPLRGAASRAGARTGARGRVAPGVLG